MVDQVDSIGGPDDGILTAYLDNELAPAERIAVEERLAAEPELRQRLAVLSAGARPFLPSYDALAAMAPAERMQAMLAGVIAQSEAAEVRRAPSPLRRYAAIAAALILFAAGGLIGYAVSQQMRPAEEPPGWRQVVAEYFVLTTPDTLAVIRNDPAAMATELGDIGSKLSLDLAPDRLMLADADLKSAQLFDFRGRPLVQLAYLSTADQPLALCIINNGRPDADIAFEEREGSNIVFWTRNGRGYMLIGKAPRAALEAYAGELAQRFQADAPA